MNDADVSFDHHELVHSLIELHQRIREIAQLSGLARIAVAIYDDKTDVLRTFLESAGGENALTHFVAKLSDVPSLRAIAQGQASQVVNDLASHWAEAPHGRVLVEHGYRASYTIPLSHNGQLRGFLFFNATRRGFFTPTILYQLWPYAQIAAFIAMMELDKIHLIEAAVRTVRQLSRSRNEETGAHLERMSRYTRLIAEELAESHGLSDEFIEFLFQFSPLHDVGKVAIPDQILLKPGRLDDSELVVMRTHVVKGKSIIDLMVQDFGMDQVPHIGILRNVVAYHHEAWDGSGYPYGLKGEQIPLEARITAVADVFDALTTTRPYKTAWSDDEAFDYLKTMSGKKFYPPCVNALIRRRAAAEEIQKQFRETTFS